MLRLFCKSKIQGLVVTRTDLHYEGSITIDSVVAEEADIRPYEMIQVLNLSNGERVETYYIPGQPGQGEVCLNGAAARWFQTGDRVIILSTGIFSEGEKMPASPRVVITNGKNEVMEKR